MVSKMFARLQFLLQLVRAQHIARRYFVTNGFDGVLAMLGLMTGFYVSDEIQRATMISASVGTAVALFMSGLSSAYISETAERQHELKELEHSMMTSLDNTAHADSARVTPILIALVNGLSPLIFALLIILPLWLPAHLLPGRLSPIVLAVCVALLLTFLLGVFLGQLSGRFWLWAGLRSLVVAVITSVLILLLHI